MRSGFSKKTDSEIAAMVPAGLLTRKALQAVSRAIKPGVSTLELDAIAEDVIRSSGGVPNFQLVPGYAHTICASINSEVVHGIPSADKILQPGDILSVDCGAMVSGWNGDSAITVIVPGATDASRELLSDVTKGALWHGIAALNFAKRLNEIGIEIENYVDERGKFGILEQYVGHGIGKTMHEEPAIFHYAVKERGPKVSAGLVVAIEPMITLGDQETFVEQDEWTVSTVDGSDGAHWEHSIALHSKGIWVLTLEDGGESELAEFGIKPIPPTD